MRRLAFLLAGALAAVAGVSPAAAAAAPSPVRLTGLTTERRTNPLAVDAARPRFGWQLSTAANGQRQSRYQVVVGTAPGRADVWDSGRVDSDTSVDVAYGGPALTARTTYHWRVRIWDGRGRSTAWSSDNTFATGLDAWRAAFIGAPGDASLSGASWIWYPEGDPVNDVPAGTRYFRHSFTVGTPGPATLVVTGDDTADVWINGSPASTSRRATDSWKRATTVDVSSLLVAGTNTIAVAGTNTSAGPAGIVLRLTGGVEVVTGTGWKASTTGPEGWTTTGYDDSAWVAAHVSAPYGSGQWGSQVSIPQPAPRLSKTFVVDKPVARARLYATALGLHETSVNGKEVTAERLSPGWTDYTKRLQYGTYDVTRLLRPGTNAVSALLGNGWYSGSIGFAGTAYYGRSPWYSAELAVDYADGTRSVTRTDGSWSVTTSPIVSDDLYHGEDQDARILAGAPRPVTVRTDAAPRVVAQVDPGVTVQQRFAPVRWTQPVAGTWVADLGQNFAGWNRLRVSGPAGTRVTLRHAEILNADGTLYTDNLRAAQATDTFTLAGTGAVETFEPHFTVHGYRYVSVTGLLAPPTAETLTGLAAWTDGAATGTFHTNDALVNGIQHNILWGARSNLLSLPTDCPQRDERLGWTGDIAAFGATATFAFDTRGLLRKFADDLVDAQHADGAYPDVAPDVLGSAGRAGWGDAGAVVPYVLWQRYGDLSAADEHFDSLARWIGYLQATSGPDLIRDQWTYGDWLNVDDNTPNDLTSTAYFGYSTRLVARMAAATGRTAEAAAYSSLADRIAAAFTARFVAADGTVGTGSQTGYVLALAYGLVPQSREQAVADKLAAAVAARDNHLSVGFMGVENLLPVLADHGHADVAYRVLQQPGYPGWGYMLSRGATTIWERWDGIRPDGTLQTPEMNSFNHYGLGSVGDWLYRGVGGLAPGSPGYRSVLVAPRPGGTVTAATTTLSTGYGRTAVDWKLTGTHFTLTLTIPANATGVVRLPVSGTVRAPRTAVAQPDGSWTVPSGTYTFTVN